MRKFLVLLFCLTACSHDSGVPVPAPPEIEGLPEAVARLVSADYRRAAERPSDANAWGRYGDSLLANGLWQQAKIAYRHAYESNPSDPQWAAHLAELLHEDSELDDANQYIIEAQRLAPDNPQIAFLAARIFEDLGRYEDALTAYRTAGQLLPGSAEIEFAIGRLLLNQGRYVESRPYLDVAMKLAPESSVVRAAVLTLSNAAPSLAVIHMPETEAMSDSRFRLPPPYQDRVVARMRRFDDLDLHWRNALSEGDYAAALRSLDLISDLYTDRMREEHWINAAFAQVTLGRTGDAKQSYQRCIESIPNSADAHLGLAELSFRDRNAANARPHFEAALRHAQTPLQRARALQGHGRIAARNGDFPGALDFLRQAERELPELAVLQMDMARVLADMQRYDAAWRSIDRAEELGFAVSDRFKIQLRRVSTK